MPLLHMTQAKNKRPRLGFDPALSLLLYIGRGGNMKKRIRFGVKVYQFGTLLLLAMVSANSVHAAKIDVGRVRSLTYRPAIACQERPEFLTEQKTEVAGNLEALSGVLVARDSEYYIEARESGRETRARAYQSFIPQKKMNSPRVICGSAPEDLRSRYSMYVPTLIDRTDGKKIGNSIWQFQLMTDSNSFSIWNKQSPVLSEQMTFEKLLKESRAHYKLYYLGNNVYEIVMMREDAGAQHFLSIRYDLVK